MSMKNHRINLTDVIAVTLFWLGPRAHLLAADDDVRPDQIQFRRQAVTRMVFDSGQDILLSSLRPAKVIDLDLMHPEMLPSPGVKWTSGMAVFRGYLRSPRRLAALGRRIQPIRHI